MRTHATLQELAIIFNLFEMTYERHRNTEEDKRQPSAFAGYPVNSLSSLADFCPLKAQVLSITCTRGMFPLAN